MTASLLQWRSMDDIVGPPPPNATRDPATRDHLMTEDKRFAISRANIQDPASAWAFWDLKVSQSTPVKTCATREGAQQEAELYACSMIVDGLLRHRIATIYHRAVRRVAGLALAARAITRSLRGSQTVRQP